MVLSVAPLLVVRVTGTVTASNCRAGVACPASLSVLSTVLRLPVRQSHGAAVPSVRPGL